MLITRTLSDFLDEAGKITEPIERITRRAQRAASRVSAVPVPESAGSKILSESDILYLKGRDAPHLLTPAEAAELRRMNPPTLENQVVGARRRAPRNAREWLGSLVLQKKFYDPIIKPVPDYTRPTLTSTEGILDRLRHPSGRKIVYPNRTRLSDEVYDSALDPMLRAGSPTDITREMPPTLEPTRGLIDRLRHPRGRKVVGPQGKTSTMAPVGRTVPVGGDDILIVQQTPDDDIAANIANLVNSGSPTQPISTVVTGGQPTIPMPGPTLPNINVTRPIPNTTIPTQTAPISVPTAPVTATVSRTPTAQTPIMPAMPSGTTSQGRMSNATKYGIISGAVLATMIASRRNTTGEQKRTQQPVYA